MAKIFGVFLFVLGTLLFFDGVMGLINCPNTFAFINLNEKDVVNLGKW